MPDLPAVTLYGKPECHLCEEAESQLASLARKHGLTFRKIDIQSSPELFERYRYSIPVVEIEGGATLDWPFLAAHVWNAVKAATRR